MILTNEQIEARMEVGTPSYHMCKQFADSHREANAEIKQLRHALASLPERDQLASDQKRIEELEQAEIDTTKTLDKARDEIENLEGELNKAHEQIRKYSVEVLPAKERELNRSQALCHKRLIELTEVRDEAQRQWSELSNRYLSLRTAAEEAEALANEIWNYAKGYKDPEVDRVVGHKAYLIADEILAAALSADTSQKKCNALFHGPFCGADCPYAWPASGPYSKENRSRCFGCGAWIGEGCNHDPECDRAADTGQPETAKPDCLCGHSKDQHTPMMVDKSCTAAGCGCGGYDPNPKTVKCICVGWHREAHCPVHGQRKKGGVPEPDECVWTPDPDTLEGNRPWFIVGCRKGEISACALPRTTVCRHCKKPIRVETGEAYQSTKDRFGSALRNLAETVPRLSRSETDALIETIPSSEGSDESRGKAPESCINNCVSRFRYLSGKWQCDECGWSPPDAGEPQEQIWYPCHPSNAEADMIAVGPVTRDKRIADLNETHDQRIRQNAYEKGYLKATEDLQSEYRRRWIRQEARQELIEEIIKECSTEGSLYFSKQELLALATDKGEEDDT